MFCRPCLLDVKEEETSGAAGEKAYFRMIGRLF